MGKRWAVNSRQRGNGLLQRFCVTKMSGEIRIRPDEKIAAMLLQVREKMSKAIQGLIREPGIPSRPSPTQD